jgi:hypothetical protein
VDNTPGDVVVLDLQGTLQMITWLDPLEAVKVMGVYQAMDGNMRKQDTEEQG